MHPLVALIPACFSALGGHAVFYRLCQAAEDVVVALKKKTADWMIVSGRRVEHTGLEPVTSTLPVSHSSQMS